MIILTFSYKDININYEIFESDEAKGNGHRPLLLLHGWMAEINAWAPVFQYFMKSRKVYVIDFPGQKGKSDKLKEVWSIPEYAQMVEEFIKAQNIIGCDVIGHSFGGRVIIYLASSNHELFNKIILTDAAGVKPKFSLKRAIKNAILSCGKYALGALMPKDKYEKVAKKARSRFGSSDYADIDSEVLRETFKNVVDLDLTDRLDKIQNSTLLIWGANDTDTPLYMAKIMEQKIKDSGLVILENAGHFSYLDNPQKYLLVANEFLK